MDTISLAGERAALEPDVRTVLTRAVAQMDGWIAALSELSDACGAEATEAQEWRSAFLTGRRHLSEAAGLHHVSLLRTPLLDPPL
jgi:hypothetical protein